MWRMLISLLLIAMTQPLVAQVRFAYYDLDKLYDTVESPFYDDSDYTPEGRFAWDSLRYQRKVRQVAAVIDSLHCDIVALYGVENEQVVRDITLQLEGDYAYLHRTINSFDGMDFALLYFADKCEPLQAEARRAMLTVEALIAGDTTGIILGIDPRFVRMEIASSRETHPTRKLLVAGKLASIDATRYGLCDRLLAPARRGHGNRLTGGRWQMRDRIFTDTLSTRKAGAVVIRREWLNENGEPCPTYRSNRYVGGAGRHLPVWCEIE